jgi:hypothetical protein
MEDLMPIFADALDGLSSSNADNPDFEAHQKLVYEAHEISNYDTQQASFVMEELHEALECYAAPYCYFGSNEDDGASIGFWPDLDGVQYGFADDVLHVDDTSKVEQELPSYVLHVNDHGNTALYSITVELKEVWAIV